MKAREFPERRTVVQGISTCYYEAGEGAVVLLLHGNGGSPRDWEPVMSDLSITHRVIALGLPGYGATSPLEDVRPPRLAAFIAAFLDKLEIDRIIAVGHSYGGLLAAELALSHPHRVTRLVLADSAGLGRAIHPSFIALAQTPRPVAELWITALLLPGSALLRAFVTGLQFRQPWQVPLRTWIDQVRLTRSRNFLHTIYDVSRAGVGPAGQTIRVSSRLKDIKIPTLVIWGLTDQIFPVWQAFDAVRKLPAGRLVIIPGAGHASFLDSHEGFLDALSPFVRDDILS